MQQQAAKKDPCFLTSGRGVDSQPKLRDPQYPAYGVAAEIERDVECLGALMTADIEEEGRVMLLQ